MCLVTIPITQATVKENFKFPKQKPLLWLQLKHKPIKQMQRKKRNMCKVRYKTNTKKEKKYV
jgi:hypothetical protein